MNFKYKWKNGSMPSRDQAARSQYLLDKEQFDNEKDRKLAEEQARKHLGVPTRIPDDDRSILPHGPSGSEDDVNEF
ncbi:bromodomain-containing protein [Scytonema tolypothrichoides VB-61278]|nr:bromodomain-containing protein [Scytonema tolypothrichoides VB-61278]